MSHHTKDRWHAVDGKEHVGAFHHKQHEKQRRRQKFSPLANEESIPGLLGRDGDHPTHKLEQEIVFGMHLLVAKSQLDPCVDQEGPEQPEKPLEPFDQLGSHNHKREPHQDSPKNPPEEHSVLVFERHLEVAEDNRKDKHVVHGQRPLNQITGQKLDRSLAAQPPPNQAVERQGQRGPKTGPESTFSQRGLVGLLVKNSQVKREHHGHKHSKAEPMNQLNLARGIQGKAF